MDPNSADRALQADVLCISSIDWGFLWQGQQEIMTRLAARGARVLFIENTGVRAPRLDDLPRILARVANWWRGSSTTQGAKGADRIEVFSPLAVPFPWNRWARWLNRFLLVRPVRERARTLHSPVIWTFLPTPSVLDTIRACRRKDTVVIYHCVGDFEELSGDPDAARLSEDELLGECDLVFVNGENLRKKFADRHPRVRIYPFGVNLAEFAVDQQPEPTDLQKLPRPRAGYIGGIHRHMAFDWLVQAAKRLPHVSFVLVGTVQTNVEKLRSQANIHILGTRPHAELAAYVSNFDVCLVPYVLTHYTETVVPTKLFEYLASGKPCVASALPELTALILPSGAVTMVRDAEGFTEAVADAIARHTSIELAEARKRFAASYSWDSLMAGMLEDIAELARNR